MSLFRRRARNAVGSTDSFESATAAESLAHVRRLELRTRWLVDSLLAGEYRSVFTGQGMEFSHVREYQPGDDVRRIDWKVTARSGGTPYVRRFVEERDLVVMLVVDVSGSGEFGPGERGVSAVTAEITAALAFAAARNNDRVGLLLVSDREELYVAPASGRAHVARLLLRMVSHRPRRSGTDLTVGLERAGRSIPARGMVFVVSDFIQDPGDEKYRNAIARVARRHDLIAVRLGNMASSELPDAGWVDFLDPESGRRVTVDTGSRRVRERYRRSLAAAHEELVGLLTEVGAGLIEVDTATDPLAPIAGFFRRRRG
jgi:uncharacterized protein (DUF58 family)